MMAAKKIRHGFNRINLLVPHRSIPVLMYHQIEQVSRSSDPLGLCVSKNSFEMQMRYLAERGFKSISIEEFLNSKNRDRRHQGNAFILTFDDGYLDNYSNAFPVLVRYGFRATIFLVSDYVGKTVSWGTRKGVQLMSWDHAKEMSDYGISFQSHTCSHADLTTLDENRILHELRDSKDKIENVLNQPVCHLAYPFGRYNRKVIELVRATKYVSAYAVEMSGRERFCRERVACGGACDWKFRMRTSAWNSWLCHTLRFPKVLYNAIG